MSPTSVQQIDAWRAAKSETEHLEFKEAKNQFSFDDLVRYCVAIGNEGGGQLVLGIANKPPRIVVGTNAFTNTQKTASDLLNKLHFRVDIEQVAHPDGRVLVFHIPSRPFRHPFEVDGTYYMRSGESLVAMTPDQLKKIFNERGSGRRLGPAFFLVSLLLVAAGFIGYKGWQPTKSLEDQKFVGVHRPDETTVIPPGSSAIISSRPLSSEERHDVDRLKAEVSRNLLVARRGNRSSKCLEKPRDYSSISKY